MADHPEMKGAASTGTKKPKTILDWLDDPQMKKRIASLSPKHISPERMLVTFSQAVRRSSPDREGIPQLLKVPQDRILGAFLICARLGLEPNSVPPQVHLIPFDVKRYDKVSKQWVVEWTDVQVIVDYQGYVELGYRSGQIEYFQASVVRAEDDWSFEYGTEHHLRHRPTKNITTGTAVEGEKIAAYSYAKIRGGGTPFEWMWWPEIEATRNGSQGYQQALRKRDEAIAKKWSVPAAWLKAPWVAHEDSMARKTPFRRLIKWLPKTAELQIAQQVDDRTMAFDKVWESSDRDVMDMDPEAYTREDDTGEADTTIDVTAESGEQTGQQTSGGNGQQGRPALSDQSGQQMTEVKTDDRQREPATQQTTRSTFGRRRG